METLTVKNPRPRAYSFNKFSSSFSDFFFPQVCFACEENNKMHDSVFCVQCAYEVAKTNHWEYPENDFTKKFMGRVSVYYGGAIFKFIAGGIFQKIVHKLKYENKPDMGVALGSLLGKKIADHWSQLPDIIVPVPMAESKKWKRGYNQAEKIAEGLSKITTIPLKNILTKTEGLISQTSFHRQERFDNMKNAFKLNVHSDLSGRHILLVDDVLTTGATLEACAIALQSIPKVIVSMATLAIGSDF